MAEATTRARTKAPAPIPAASRFAAALYLAYANAAPTPKITKNANIANALFCFMSIVSVD
jgi:hypothetical protein